jgi:regulator of protease activity HflC (stomatin/prohibitin superfamily)
MKTKMKTTAIVVVILLFAAFLLLNCFTIIPAGHTGVVLTLGKVNDRVMQEGFHLKAPFVQEVVRIDNRVTKLEVDTEAFSKD